MDGVINDKNKIIRTFIFELIFYFNPIIIFFFL